MLTATKHPEAVSEKFNPQDLDKAQTRAWQLLRRLKEHIRPGMTESQAHAIAQTLQQEAGAEKYWHPVKIRFGKNTLCSFREPSDESVVLKDNDIFFLDLGPLFDGYEGDCGQSFTVGEFPEGEKIIRAGEEIFKAVSERFRATGQSGVELYQYAEQLAKEAGYELVGEGAKGHRISDFPHAIYYRGSLREYAENTTAYRWILEIQLRDRARQIGAFFEDILR